MRKWPSIPRRLRVDVRARLRQVPIQELVLPVVIIALVIVGAIIRPGVFLTSDNLLNVLTQASITGIIAIGMTFVIATGGIDLSVGSVLAAACIAGGLLAKYGLLDVHAWRARAWHCSSARSTGLAITWGKVVPFIATLAMLIIARGLALLRCPEKTPISTDQKAGHPRKELRQWPGARRWPVPALVFVAVTIAWLGAAQPHPYSRRRDGRRR